MYLINPQPDNITGRMFTIKSWEQEICLDSKKWKIDIKTTNKFFKIFDKYEYCVKR